MASNERPPQASGVLDETLRERLIDRRREYERARAEAARNRRFTWLSLPFGARETAAPAGWPLGGDFRPQRRFGARSIVSAGVVAAVALVAAYEIGHVLSSAAETEAPSAALRHLARQDTPSAGSQVVTVPTSARVAPEHPAAAAQTTPAGTASLQAADPQPREGTAMTAVAMPPAGAESRPAATAPAGASAGSDQDPMLRTGSIEARGEAASDITPAGSIEKRLDAAFPDTAAALRPSKGQLAQPIVDAFSTPSPVDPAAPAGSAAAPSAASDAGASPASGQDAASIAPPAAGTPAAGALAAGAQAGGAPAATEVASATTSASTVTANVNMRAKPDNDASIVAVVPKGGDVGVIHCEMWCEVTAAGKRGWIFKTFVKDAGKTTGPSNG